MKETDFKTLARNMAGREGVGGSAILFTIAALIVVLFSWASFAELDNVTRGEGRVVSSVQNQLVQAAEGGVILRRYVSENSFVTKDEILFEIDPIDASSELNSIITRLASLEMKEARLRAEISGEVFEPSSALRARAPAVALTEESLFAARRGELAGTISVLEQRLRQREQDMQAAETDMETAQRTMDLLEQEIDVVEPLVQENIAPATRLLELQRELEQARGSRDRSVVAMAQSRSGIDELLNEIENARESYILKSMEEINAAVAEKSELLEALPRLEERVRRTVIRAPMDGIVNRLNFQTPGGYVNIGDIVLELVPTGEALVVEAKIAPKDISNILPDDAVRIRFSAYDSAKYGTVDGRVIRISPDATVDTENSGSSHYLIDVAIEGELLVDQQVVQFMPGMTATVDVLSGKRTVLEYVWQPVARVQELALRD